MQVRLCFRRDRGFASLAERKNVHTRIDAQTCLTKLHGKERKVDRTGQRAEIKGRRGDEFVKKAEAGQQHASRTSKRQDEMKSNRCPSPPLLETLFSTLLFSFPPPLAPLPSFYPLSFLSPDFLLRRLRHFFFSFFFYLFFAFSLQSSVLHIRFTLAYSLSLSRSSYFDFLSVAFVSHSVVERASRRKIEEQRAGKGEKIAEEGTENFLFFFYSEHESVTVSLGS